VGNCFHRETDQAELQHVKLEITIYIRGVNSRLVLYSSSLRCTVVLLYRISALL
jgi:hypothetical protein